MEFIDKKVVSINNLMMKFRKRKCSPKNLLILFPHCIQNSQCKQNVKNDLNECKRCGKCKIKDLLEFSEKYGVNIVLATGGRVALQRVMAEDIHGVIAIACEKELRTGLMAAMSKAIFAVPNLRPHGYCKDTDVYLDEVKEAIEKFLK